MVRPEHFCIPEHSLGNPIRTPKHNIYAETLMSITFGTPADLNIDQTAGVQGSPIDDTGAYAALQAETAYSYLLPAGTPGTFPQVAYDASFITSTVTGGTVVSDLIFTLLFVACHHLATNRSAEGAEPRASYL